MKRSQARRRSVGVAAMLAALVISAVAAPTSHAQDGFEISGEVEALYPGVDATLEATVTNPHPFAIRVTHAGSAVLDAAAECPASMIQVDDAEPGVVIPAHSTGTVSLRIRMSRNAPDACQGVTWPLRFTGVAQQVSPAQLPSTSLLDPLTMPWAVVVGAALLGAAWLGVALLAARRRWRTPKGAR